MAPDGKLALTASLDQTARLWEVQTGVEVRRFQVGSQVWSAAFSPDGQTILTGSSDKLVRLWDAQTGKEVRQLAGHGLQVNSVAFSADGKAILTSSADGTARLWDARTGQETQELIGHSGAVWSAVLSADGKTVLTGGADRTARLWEADPGDFLRAACSRVFRDLTDGERAQYGVLEAAPTCPRAAWRMLKRLTQPKAVWCPEGRSNPGGAIR